MVSIITVNHNGLADTCELIDSFHRHETYPYEIIVVDNGSILPEGEEIKKRYQDVKSVPNINNGFAGGNNAGLQVAEGDYLFFINNDTIIKSPILEVLVRQLQEKGTGAVSPKIKYTYEPDTIQYAGFSPFSSITLRNKSIGYKQKDVGQYSVPQPTASVHGAAMMTRRDVLKQVGPMAEVFFLFYEEFDWSARMRRAGYELWYVPSAVVYHKESMTARRGTPLREFYLSRARLLFARRNTCGYHKTLSCIYICCIAAPKKAVGYILHKEFSLARAVLCGTWKGLISPCH